MRSEQACQIWHPNRVRLVSNGTNWGLVKISFSIFWLVEQKCTDTDLKKSEFCPIGCQTGSFWDKSDVLWREVELRRKLLTVLLVLQALRLVDVIGNWIGYIEARSKIRFIFENCNHIARIARSGHF